MGRRHSRFPTTVIPAQGCGHDNGGERGNAILFLFVAVALLGVLSYAFLQGSRGSTDMMTNEQAKAYAHHIIGYANDVETAVKRLQLRGCKDTDISFENSVVTGYINTNNPPNTCKVFSIEGGGLTWKKLPAHIADDWYYSGAASVYKVGTYQGSCPYYTDPASCADLLMRAVVPKEICLIINDKAGIANPDGNPPVSSVWTKTGSKFQGTYTGTHYIVGAGINGKRTGCYREHPTATYFVFYRVLIAR